MLRTQRPRAAARRPSRTWTLSTGAPFPRGPMALPFRRRRWYHALASVVRSLLKRGGR